MEPFVGRDAELARLLREFLHRAEAADPELIVAVGECNAQTGVGDPYLPFREVMAVLTGDVESRLARGALTQDGVGRVTAFLLFHLVRRLGQSVPIARCDSPALTPAAEIPGSTTTRGRRS
jgi:hypothetical protein